MTVYIDAGYRDADNKLRHRLWADTEDELHEFAHRVLGIKRDEAYTDPPHYNIAGGKPYSLAFRGGAAPANFLAYRFKWRQARGADQ